MENTLLLKGKQKVMKELWVGSVFLVCPVYSKHSFKIGAKLIRQGLFFSSLA